MALKDIHLQISDLTASLLHDSELKLQSGRPEVLVQNEQLQKQNDVLQEVNKKLLLDTAELITENSILRQMLKQRKALIQEEDTSQLFKDAELQQILEHQNEQLQKQNEQLYEQNKQMLMDKAELEAQNTALQQMLPPIPQEEIIQQLEQLYEDAEVQQMLEEFKPLMQEEDNDLQLLDSHLQLLEKDKEKALHDLLRINIKALKLISDFLEQQLRSKSEKATDKE